ncbi:G2/mitotic-specific cyclin-B3 isoform X2 [Lemur catta]|uniref:G2/mitotic-specific cyclin-B3 isoform X2 n=1 Tax=Lemur catta TaxID=9447 RepID=UPI001E26E246|nr:G2/mitotic-specific cyclin-B3 isoform X2 [Lemur catta]
MPLPPPPQSSKPKTKKSPSSEIVPSDHNQHEKRGENYQANISPSSLQEALKKRLAFEDLTNAVKSKPDQPEKEANTEFLKPVFRKINRNTYVIELDKNTEMALEGYKPESSPVVASTTLAPNIVEKPRTLEIPTISKTPTTEEASLMKKPIILEEEPPTTETISIKKSLKKYTYHKKVPQLEKPLTLLEETDEDTQFVVEPMTFRVKHNSEVNSKRTLSLKRKLSTHQGNQSCQEEELALQDTDVEEDYFFLEPVNFRKKPKTEASNLTRKPLILKTKYPTEGMVSSMRKQPILQKTISGKKSLTAKPLSFKKKTTTEEKSFIQEPSMLQKKCTTQGDVDILKKPWALQGMSEKHTTQEKVSTLKKPLALQKSPTEKESLSKEALAFKKKRTIEEATLTNEALPLNKKHTTQGKMSCLKQPVALQKTTSGEKSLIKEPSEEKVSLKKEKCTTQVKYFWEELFDTSDEDEEDENSFLMEPVPFKENPKTEEVFITKKSLFLKKTMTQEQISFSKKPLVLQKTTSEEESFCKKLLPFKKKSTTEEEFLFQEPSTLQEKHTTEQEASLSKESLALQESTTEKESYIKELLPLKEKPTTEEESLFQEQFSSHDKPTNKDESFFQKTLVLQEKTYTKEDSLKKLLVLQEKSIIEEESLLKKPLVMKKDPSSEAAISTKKKSSLKKKPTVQGEVVLLKKQLALHENITNDEESLINQPLALEKYPIINKEASFKEPFTMQEKPSIEEEAILKEPTTDTQAHFKEPLALQEKASIEKETLLKEPLPLQKKPGVEKEAIMREVLALQEKLNTVKEALLKESFILQQKPAIPEAFLFPEVLAVNEKPTTEELSSKEPLALDENPTHKEDTSLKTLISQVETRPHVSITAPESRTGKSSVVKSSATRKSSACESGSNKLFSSEGKRTPKEPMTHLVEDVDKDNDPLFNTPYAKDIFSYMKEREMSFQMNHETLYLAVKLVDHYLMEVECKKYKLQLLGCTAFLIAAKFEELYPPSVDELMYSCANIYCRHEIHAMEISILKALKFDINIPVAYHFLRRYASCIRCSVKTVMLSHFICELTLQEYDYIQERASKLAAGSYLLALYIQKLQCLIPALECYSGYKASELHPLVRRLNMMLTTCSRGRLKTVYSKYSRRAFRKVAKIPPVKIWKLDLILNC